MERINDIYSVKLHNEGLQVISEYAKTHPYLRGSAEYKAIATLRQLIEAVENADAGYTFRTLWALLQEEMDYRAMADYLLGTRLSWDIQTPEQGVLWCLCGNALKDKKFLSQELYQQAKSRYSHAKAIEDPKLTGAKLTAAAGTAAGERIFQYLMWACAAEPALISVVCEDREGIAQLLQALIADCGRSTEKWIPALLENAPAQLQELVTSLLAENKPKPGNIFAKLFGKK
jgi:hypothetical protein